MVPAGADPEAGQAVAPGQSFTYTWVVPDEVRGQSVRGVGEGCDPPSLRRPWTFPLLEPRALPDLQVFLCLQDLNPLALLPPQPFDRLAPPPPTSPLSATRTPRPWTPGRSGCWAWGAS